MSPTISITILEVISRGDYRKINQSFSLFALLLCLNQGHITKMKYLPKLLVQSPTILNEVIIQ